MTLEEALAAVASGERVTAPTISRGWVVKLQRDGWNSSLRVVHEVTGDSFAFDENKPEHQTADWQLVEGWAL